MNTTEANGHYWKGLNRYVPIAQLGRGIFIPRPPFKGAFERIRNSEEIELSRVFATRPVARLVAPLQRLSWEAPTVIQEVHPRGRGYIMYQNAAPMSGYRYLQLAARREDLIPVLDPRDGRIYDLSPLLDSRQLRFFRKVYRFTSLRMCGDYRPQRGVRSGRQTITPAADGAPVEHASPVRRDGLFLRVRNWLWQSSGSRASSGSKSTARAQSSTVCPSTGS